MDAAELAARLEGVGTLLMLIVGLCVLYFLIPNDGAGDQVTRGRDIEREHALGAHRNTAAWGCKKCSEGDR